MGGPVIPYALATSLLLRETAALLADELAAELAATEAYLLDQDSGVPLALPAPADLRRAYMPRTRDRLPQVAIHAMRSATVTVDSMGADVLETQLRITVVVGEGDLRTIDESGYSDAMMAYLMAMSGLVQRELPPRTCQTIGVYEVRHRDARWDPQTTTVRGWINAGHLDLTVYQTVVWDRPAPPVPVFEPDVFVPEVFL